MKKKNLITLLFLPVLITSCSGSTGNETKLPNNGTAIDRAVGKEKLKAAVKSEVEPEGDNDAFGFSISGAHFSESFTGGITVANQSVATISSKIEAKNGKINFGVKGHTGKSANDFRATLSASININGNYNTTYNTQIAVPTADASAAATPSTNAEFKGDYAVSADLFEKNLYVDLSNKQVFSLLSTFLGQYTSSLPASGKAKVALNMSDEDFPLISNIDTTEFDDAYEEFYSSLPDDGEFKDHGKAGYSYSGKLTGTKLNEEVSSDSSTSNSLSYTFGADSSFSYALIFNESGFVSFGIDANLGITTTVDLGTTDIGYKMNYSGNLSFGLKFEFLRGNDVKFPTVDTSAYTTTSITTAY